MRPEKQLLLDEIQGHTDSSSGMIITSYGKLDPNTAYNFRNKITQSGGLFEVVRKRIFLKAMDKAGIAIDKQNLEGHIGVVFALQDPIQVTKAIYQFSEENQDIFTVLGARVEGKMLAAAEVKALSQLPSKDQMRAELLGLFQAPMAELLGVIEALLTSVMHAVDNKSKS